MLIKHRRIVGFVIKFCEILTYVFYIPTSPWSKARRWISLYEELLVAVVMGLYYSPKTCTGGVFAMIMSSVVDAESKSTVSCLSDDLDSISV